MFKRKVSMVLPYYYTIACMYVCVCIYARKKKTNEIVYGRKTIRRWCEKENFCFIWHGSLPLLLFLFIVRTRHKYTRLQSYISWLLILIFAQTQGIIPFDLTDILSFLFCFIRKNTYFILSRIKKKGFLL